MAKSKIIYHIKLSDWVLHDPKMRKKATTYVPISLSFLNSRQIDFITAGELKLMISFIKDAYKFGRSSLEVDPKLYRSQGKVFEKSISNLSDYGYLTYSKRTINKEINELNNSSINDASNDSIKAQQNAEQIDNNNNAELLIKSSDVVKSQKPNPVQSFDDRFTLAEYLTELQELKLDHPVFKNNLRLIHERFKTAQAFTEFVLSTCENKTYKALKSKNDSVSCDKYLTKTLKAEMGIL